MSTHGADRVIEAVVKDGGPGGAAGLVLGAVAGWPQADPLPPSTFIPGELPTNLTIPLQTYHDWFVQQGDFFHVLEFGTSITVACGGIIGTGITWAFRAYKRANARPGTYP